MKKPVEPVVFGADQLPKFEEALAAFQLKLRKLGLKIKGEPGDTGREGLVAGGILPLMIVPINSTPESRMPVDDGELSDRLGLGQIGAEVSGLAALLLGGSSQGAPSLIGPINTDSLTVNLTINVG